jgi:hypothetical protein
MKKYILITLLSFSLSVDAQDFGLSFSYFIPKNGYFSTPISPFSIRGVGVNINRFISVETGASLYRMSGLNVKGMPFTTKDPIVGPNFTLMIPGELVFSLQSNKIEFDIKGGGFAFLPFANKLNYGNLDKAIRKFKDWKVANATADFESELGYGWMAGAELTLHVTQQVGISFETNYMAGQAKFPIKGSYEGGNDTISTEDFSYNDAKMDLTGLEFSIGVILSSGSGSKKARPR